MGLFFLFVWFPRRFSKNNKNLRENQKYKRKPKKPQKHFRENTKTTQFLKVSDPPLDMGLFFLLFLVSPEIFTKPKLLRKPQNTKENQRKPQKTPKTLGKTKTTVFKGFKSTLGYGFCFFVCLVFPKVFRKPKQLFRKPDTKENQRKPKKT